MFAKISDHLKERAKKIKLIGFDVDGVLTDGSLYIGEHGELAKRFHSLDGLGIKMAIQFDINIAIISARNSIQTHVRFNDLGVKEIHTDVNDKFVCANEILERYGITMSEFAYIGDDSVDVPILEKAGLAACPKEAHYSVFDHIHYITERPAGYGAAREFVDLILHCQGKIP